jgi:hypothetical protein
MKSINQYIQEKLFIKKSSSEPTTPFNIIKLFEEVMNMRYNDATEDFKNHVNAFAEECIDDYKNIEIVTEGCGGFSDATYKIVELGKKYKFEKIGPSKWDEYSDILYGSKEDKILEVDFGENPIDEDITISHYEGILLYTTGGEGNFIIKA